MTQSDGKLRDDLQQALSEGLLGRLPLTFLPFVNQQLRQWSYLFPQERQSIERLLTYLAHSTPGQSAELFRDVLLLEDKMGVRHWQFSTTEQTIQNSSQLARSPYFQEWRRAVQAVYDMVDRDAENAAGVSEKSERRLVLLSIPRPLPLDPATVWRRWQGIGRIVALDLSAAPSMETLLAGSSTDGQVRFPGLLTAARNRLHSTPADTWVVDAGRSAVDAVLAHASAGPASESAVLLSYARLDVYRQSFSHEMNTMHKDLADADAVFDRLRKVEVTAWSPPEVAAHPAVREFIRSLYLTGNGAVIFGNSFVEWAASEAFRRARPSILAAQFGMRSKPKPFTGVAVFDNPDQVNPLPAVDDLEGSAIDAQMLALYVWLAATRYEEYQHSTVCLCIAESISQAYLIAPPEFELPERTRPFPLVEIGAALSRWIA